MRTATTPNALLDATDRLILGILQKDARISFRDLGRKVHLSANAAAARVQRLQARKVIRAFTAVVEPMAMGISVQAHIDVRLRPGTSAVAFRAAVAKMPTVVSMTILTGAADVRLRVACRDQAELGQLIELLRGQAGAHETVTSVVLQTERFEHRLAAP